MEPGESGPFQAGREYLAQETVIYCENDGIPKLRICGPKGEDNISSSPQTSGKETKCGPEAALNG